MNRYVQPPQSRLPSGDLSSAGMSFMHGRGMPYGSNPATWSPTVSGGTIVRRGDGSYHDVGNFGLRSQRRMRGSGSCGCGLASVQMGVHAPGNKV
mgnify:CR=1 FL=1